MSIASEHQRLKPVLDLVKRLDILNNPDPQAIFEPGPAGFSIQATRDNHPEGEEWVSMASRMDKGGFTKPCAYIGDVRWGWEGDQITHLLLETNPYILQNAGVDAKKIRNRPKDVVWAKRKVRSLFKQAGVKCPKIVTWRRAGKLIVIPGVGTFANCPVCRTQVRVVDGNIIGQHSQSVLASDASHMDTIPPCSGSGISIEEN